MDSDDPDLEAFKSNLCRILGDVEDALLSIAAA